MRAFILEGDAADETPDVAAVRAALPSTIENIWSDRPSAKAHKT